MQVMDDPRYEIDEDNLRNIMENISSFTENIEIITLMTIF